MLILAVIHSPSVCCSHTSRIYIALTLTLTLLTRIYCADLLNSAAQWEGDFRLWEALSSGALVFVDPVMVPHPHPLEHGRHVVFFQQNNSSDLEAKLDHYRANPEEARRIALAGYLHVMTFHRTACSVDYILRTAEVKRAQLEEGGEQGGEGAGRLPRGGYAYTGQSLLAQVRRQEVAIKESGLPGKFEEHALERRHRRRAP